MTTRKIRPYLLLLLLAAIPLTGFAQADQKTTLPAWEKLSEEQRDVLVAQVRERWDAAPEERARMLEHARRWKSMTPEQREQARRGQRRFENMPPEERERARAIFAHTRKMSEEQRRQFQQRWDGMSAAQREKWLREHPVEERGKH